VADLRWSPQDVRPVGRQQNEQTRKEWLSQCDMLRLLPPAHASDPTCTQLHPRIYNSNEEDNLQPFLLSVEMMTFTRVDQAIGW
jgi:hypothetical protein